MKSLRLLCRPRARLPCAALLGLLLWPVSRAAAQEEIGAHILLRGRIEALRSGITARAGSDALLARAALTAFYEARAFHAAWMGTPAGEALLAELAETIREASEHGLDPRDYHLEALDSVRRIVALPSATAADTVDLELLASDAFMVLGSHLLHGRVNPETINPEWLANRRNAALDVVLAEVIASTRVRETLLSLAPQQARYQRMLEQASHLREIAAEGGWPLIVEGPRLELGVTDGRVPRLRQRLIAGGDLGPAASGGEGSTGEQSELFDEELAAAVRRFQLRHGLDADGVVGPATRAALNIGAGERARQIEINLERWRWLPSELGERHIEVNIAGFDVKVVERGRTVQVHRAVVGRQYRQTPMFSGVMTYLVLSPYWHVPPTIAAVDKLPIIKQDQSAIAQQRMTLLDQSTNEPVDPGTVDWASISGSEFNRRYRLRQDPGPANALGAVKFMFPNRHNVYLHDTPSRELFERASRSFSSGCIRIDNPLDLVEYLLADQPQWTRERIERVAAGGVETTVRLTAGVPVHLLYWTAWADEEGRLHFRDDIYGRDGAVERSMGGSPPGA